MSLMAAITKILLVISYGVLVLPSRLIELLFGRDSLQRWPSPTRSSYWVSRNPYRDVEGYFSEQPGAAKSFDNPGSPEQKRDERNHRPIADYLMPFFLIVARVSAPPELRDKRSKSTSGQNEAGIPDEIYTLW